MFTTLIAFIFALLLHFSSIGKETVPNLPVMGIVVIAVATLFLFLPTLVMALSWSPLQQSEQHLTPRVTELFRKDNHIYLANALLIVFPLLSYIIAIDILFLNLFNKNILLPIWLVLFGIALDALFYLIRRISNYFDPFTVSNMFTKEAKKSIQNDREMDLCDWIDAESEMAFHALNRSSTSLCVQVTNELQQIMRLFLNSTKSISHPKEDPQSKESGITDKVTFTLFFLLQRLEAICERAIGKGLEPICSNIISVLGKIAVDCAQCDISLVRHPVYYLGKLTVKAQSKGLPIVGTRGLLTLLGVAKSIVEDTDVKYAELQEPFFTLINQMNDITKELFRNDKMLSIKLLTKPFYDLRDMFLTDKMATHQDTPAIVQQISNVIAEYDALEAVLKSIPAIPIVPPVT